MRFILIAGIVALMAGLLYDKLVNEEVAPKELVSSIGDISVEVAKKAGDIMEENNINEESIKENAEKTLSKAGELLSNIDVESILASKEKLEELLSSQEAFVEAAGISKDISCENIGTALKLLESNEPLADENLGLLQDIYKGLIASGKSKEEIHEQLENMFCK